MATLSATDKTHLTKDQQAQVAALKKQWAAANAAGDQAGMEAAHRQAEAIRNSAGYTGGASGSGYQKVAANAGGQTADQVRQWAEDYTAANYDPKKGWTNGYSVDMNTRSKANYIRQQMDANSKAWHTASDADKEYLHQQNVELAKVLADYTGQSEKNYSYDPVSGKWYTWNPNVGYGENLNWTMPNVVSANKQYLGVTDEDIAKWNGDTSRYYNFVDHRGVRKGVDESSGFTGVYSQFVNGPYVDLMTRGSRKVNPALYTDGMGDGFGYGENGVGGDIVYDENGNIINRAPAVRGNNGLTDYTAGKAAYTQNGVIQPGILGGGQAGTSGRVAVQKTGSFYDANNKTLSQIGGGRGQSYKGGDYRDYIAQMYEAALQAQLQQLEAAYRENLAALEAEKAQTDGIYAEQKRQADGAAAQQAALWRETANAMGLNSGAAGQAVLVQNNQLLGELNELRAAQAAAQAELLRERTRLSQAYESAIAEAMAENNFEKVSALYEEAVRVEEAMQKQAQFDADLALQYAKLALSKLTKKQKEGA